MKNTILTQNVRMGLNGKKHRRNLLQIVIGGSGAGKTRFFCKPNLMQANCSFLVTDPKGEMLRAVAPLLIQKGYVILAAYGFKNIFIVDPQDLAAMEKAVQDALASTEPAAIITRRPCLLIKRIEHDIGKCEVDRDTCIGCKMCLGVGCPAVMVKDKKASIDPDQCVGCTICAQVCPMKAITRKEN